MSSVETLGIVPARGGSVRLPAKNKRLFNGKPLVSYAIEAALAARELSMVVMSTDDLDILDIGARYEELHCLARPTEIAGADAPAISYVHHALETLACQFDEVAVIQPTSPLTLAIDIDETLQLLRSTGACSAASIVKLDHAVHPMKLKTLDGSHLRPFLLDEGGRMMESELPDIYVRNGSVYAATIGTVKQGRLVDDDCVGYVMPRERSVDINDATDLAHAEYLSRHLAGSAQRPRRPVVLSHSDPKERHG